MQPGEEEPGYAPGPCDCRGHASEPTRPSRRACAPAASFYPSAEPDRGFSEVSVEVSRASVPPQERSQVPSSCCYFGVLERT